MNKRKIGILGLVAFLMFSPRVHATCDYETQVKLARESTNVKAVYEVGIYGTGEYEDSEVLDENDNPIPIELEEQRLEANILNLTENLYVVVRNKKTGEETTYHYSDSDQGTISWQETDFEEIKEYEITVYSEHQDCSGTELNKLSLVLPKFNEHSVMPYCYEVNAYYCQEWITEPIYMSDQEVESRGYAEQMKHEEEKKEEKENKENFWSKYIVYISLGIVLIIGVAAVVIVIKKQRSKVL